MKKRLYFRWSSLVFDVDFEVVYDFKKGRTRPMGDEPDHVEIIKIVDSEGEDWLPKLPKSELDLICDYAHDLGLSDYYSP